MVGIGGIHKNPISLRYVRNWTGRYGTASGTNTYTLTLSPALESYTEGQVILVKFTNANTGASTININGLGAKSITKDGATALSAADIAAGEIILLMYDGAQFQISAGGGGGGSGTVTSVAMTVPSFLSVSGSPITTSGTLAVSLATQLKNLVFASDATTDNQAPTFRSLVNADLPTVAVTKGGTGLTTIAANRIWYASGADTVTTSANLTYNGTALNINAGTAIGSEALIVRATADVAIMSMINTTTSQGTGFIIGESSSLASNYKFGSAYGGNQTGSSIPLAGMYRIAAGSGASLNLKLLLGGTPIYALASATGTNAGWVLDTTGLRVDTINNLHTSNNNRLTINGNTYLGANATATAKLHIAAGTSTANTAPLQIENGTRETTARAGLLELENNFYATKNSTWRFGISGTVFESYTDAGTPNNNTETDLYSYTVPANGLAVNGDSLEAIFNLNCTSAVNGKTTKIYFGGTAIFDSGSLFASTAASIIVRVFIIRDSSTTIRYSIMFSATNGSTPPYNTVGKLTGLTLSSTNVFKITGTIGGIVSTTNILVAESAKVKFLPNAG